MNAKKRGGVPSLFPSSRKLSRAIRYLGEGRGKEAFSLFADLASKGDVEAQYRVGQCYLGGVGVPVSLSEGARWLYRAADAGHAAACFSLATLYITGLPEGFDPTRLATSLSSAQTPDAPRRPDFHKALLWARKGGEAGNADAQALVGYLLSNGPKEMQDPSESRRWYERAVAGDAAQGHYGYGLILLNEARTPEERARAAGYFRKAAEAGVGTACAALAWMHEKGFGVEQDIRKAADLYLKAANAGIASAQTRYGLMLLKGVGVKTNTVRAENWLRRAARGGDAEAAALLGDLYVRGDALLKKPMEAIKWYQIAAEQGHGAAARALAALFLTGTGTPRDPEKAGHWLNIAAEKGDRYADADLGNLILAGIQQDESGREALYARLQALAEEGDKLAAFNLGVCLARGIGGRQDKAQAVQWLKKAMDGVVNAQYWYGRLLFEAGGALGDPAEGAQWIGKAADAGMADACAAFAQILITGYAPAGIKPDHKRALDYYQRAADQGNVDALFSLGAMYGGGHDVPEDRAKAQDYFEQAAQQGHALAQMMLGRYLLGGWAGKTDKKKGRMWLERAAAQGVDEAQENLAALTAKATSGGRHKA